MFTHTLFLPAKWFLQLLHQTFCMLLNKAVILKMYLKIVAKKEKKKNKITLSHHLIGNNFIESPAIFYGEELAKESWYQMTKDWSIIKCTAPTNSILGFITPWSIQTSNYKWDLILQVAGLLHQSPLQHYSGILINGSCKDTAAE